MTDEIRYHLDPDKLGFIVNSAALSADLDKLGVRSWLPSEIAEMAQGKEWGQGIDTATTAAAIRSMTLDAEGLAIECDPQGFQDVVTGYLASNAISWTTGAATFKPAPPTVEHSTKIVLFMVYCAARRGVERMFDPLPKPWWSMVVEPQAELSDWLKFPEFLMRMETTLRPMAHKAPDLFTSATADEIEKRERLLVRAMMSDTELQQVAVEWELTAEELAVHRYLLERFAQSGYLRTKMEVTPGDILDGCGWDGTKDNYRRLKEAIHRLRTVGRLRAYKHKEDREELLGRTGKGSPRKGRREKMGAFVNSGPLWDVEPFYVDGGDRVLYYVFRPMGNLFHHVNTHHQGRPAYYRYERPGLLPILMRELASNSDGVQAALLLSAIKSAKGNADGEGWLVFDYKETAKALQLPTMGKLPTRAPRDEREEKIKERIQGLVTLGLNDRAIAENLSEALAEEITRTEAKKLRERLVGGSLAPRAPTDPRKLRPKLEKMLKALQSTHPEFLLEWAFPVRGPRWSVRIAPQWSPR